MWFGMKRAASYEELTACCSLVLHAFAQSLSACCQLSSKPADFVIEVSDCLLGCGSHARRLSDNPTLLGLVASKELQQRSCRS